MLYNLTVTKEAVLESFPAVLESSFQREAPATTINDPRQKIRLIPQKFVGLTEREIVNIARNGHPDAAEAFDWIYGAYYPRVFRYELARTGNPEQAEDLTSEVMIKIWEALPRFQWRDVPFSAWVFQIAHNQLISHRGADKIRKKTSELLANIPGSAEGPEETVVNDMERRANSQKVFEAQTRLSVDQSAVITLRFRNGLSVAETARVMGKSENSVKVLQSRALKRIRGILITDSQKP